MASTELQVCRTLTRLTERGEVGPVFIEYSQLEGIGIERHNRPVLQHGQCLRSPEHILLVTVFDPDAQLLYQAPGWG